MQKQRKKNQRNYTQKNSIKANFILLSILIIIISLYCIICKCICYLNWIWWWWFIETNDYMILILFINNQTPESKTFSFIFLLVSSIQSLDSKLKEKKTRFDRNSFEPMNNSMVELTVNEIASWRFGSIYSIINTIQQYQCSENNISNMSEGKIRF